MRPDNDKQPGNSIPSIDGIRPGAPVRPPAKGPEYRYDHELPAPKPQVLLEDDHKPDLLLKDQNKPLKRKRSVKKWLFIGLGAVLLSAIAGLVGAYAWYQQQLAPVTSDTAKRVKVTIVEGATPSAIGQQLKDANVIRSQTAFAIYTKLTGTQDTLKAGTYSLQPSISTPAIVDHLVSGKQDTFRIMFRPGETIADTKATLIKAGFTESEVDAALAKSYDRPLFAGKPAGTSLEGYIFGETYEFTVAATVETVLNRTFDEYEAFINENNLLNAYQARGMSLYEGITLASIIQKEVSGAEDSRQVAQVFYKRLAQDMPLGADATFVYAAKQAGRQPTVNFQSPYNTRINKGLPPGPISAPGVHALRASANPAPGDYLFFVSGDDGINYFSRTLAEHEAATRAHCMKNCALF